MVSDKSDPESQICLSRVCSSDIRHFLVMCFSLLRLIFQSYLLKFRAPGCPLSWSHLLVTVTLWSRDYVNLILKMRKLRLRGKRLSLKVAKVKGMNQGLTQICFFPQSPCFQPLHCTASYSLLLNSEMKYDPNPMKIEGNSCERARRFRNISGPRRVREEAGSLARWCQSDFPCRPRRNHCHGQGSSGQQRAGPLQSELWKSEVGTSDAKGPEEEVLFSHWGVPCLLELLSSPFGAWQFGFAPALFGSTLFLSDHLHWHTSGPGLAGRW